MISTIIAFVSFAILACSGVLAAALAQREIER